jgi:CheY-like chemotaxis protein
MFASPESLQNLSGRRVLLVEDNYLVGASMRRMLEHLGCEVVGPVAAVAEAELLAQSEALDCGILDINILGGTSTPVAQRLTSRGCRFVFISGYGSPQNLPADLRAVPRLAKPVDESNLADTLQQLCA